MANVENQQFIRGAVNQSTRKQAITLSAGFRGGWWANDEQADVYYWFFEWILQSVWASSGWGSRVIGPYTHGSGTHLGWDALPYSTNQLVVKEWAPGTVLAYTSPVSDSNYPGGQTQLSCDRSYRVVGVSYGYNFPSSGSLSRSGPEQIYKTNPAANFAAALNQAATITFNSAQITGTYTPNTHESTYSVTVEYKRQDETGWSVGTTYSGGGTESYSPIAFGPVTLSGLSPATTYNVRVTAKRYVYTTNPLGYEVYEMAPGEHISFTTLSANPDVVTLPATSIGAQSATLNASVDPNQIACSLYFDLGTSPGVYTVAVGPYSIASTEDGARTIGITTTGLNDGTTYYYRARVDYTSTESPELGAEVSFSTFAEIVPDVRNEDLMQTVYFEGLYNTAKVITFTLKQLADDSQNQFYSGTAPVDADITMIFRPWGGGAETTGSGSSGTVALVAGSGYLYKLTLTAGEMQGEVIDIILHSADTNARPFRDAHFQIVTKRELSSMTIDATNVGVDTDALYLKGYGTGAGLHASGGALGEDIEGILNSGYLRVFKPALASSGTTFTFDTSSGDLPLDEDYFNGCIVSAIAGGAAAGEGQSRVIVYYNNGTATLDEAFTQPVTTDATCVVMPGPRMWSQTPSEELDTVPNAVASYGEYLQLLFQRFAFKIQQQPDVQTWYDSSNDPIFNRTVSDDGQNQIIEKLLTIT